MKKIVLLSTALFFMIIMHAQTRLDIRQNHAGMADKVSIRKVDGFPDKDSGYAKGVSALYAGILGKELVIAGGTNFPNIPVADGGKKVYYSSIYTAKPDGCKPLRWKEAGQLPDSSAYGVTISTEQGLVCIAGNTAKKSLSRVLLLSKKGRKIQIHTWPSLPVTMDNMAGASIGKRIFVFGGNVNGIPSNKMYSLDYSNLEQGWQEEKAMPGISRIQSVCVARKGKLYVWGGFALATKDAPASLSVDGYCYDPVQKSWTPVATPVDAGGNTVSLGGGVGTVLHDGRIACMGGVDKDIFLKALQGVYKGKEYYSHPVEWYRFSPRLLIYQPETDTWTEAGEFSQCARAGAALVPHGKCFFIINGELMPGIRTNDINCIRIE